MRMLLPMLVVLSGCAKKNSQAIEELKPAYAQVREKLKTLEPKTASLDDVEGKISGVFDEHDDLKSTVTIITADQALDPDFRDFSGDLKRFDPIAGGAFLRCLEWTGPKNPMADSALGNREGDRLQKECEAAALPKTVVVVRTVASVTPQLVEDGKFTGGRAEICVTAIDWATGKVVSRFTVNGEPDATVNYTVRTGESKALEAAKSVHSSMWVDARKKLFDGLKHRGVTIN